MCNGISFGTTILTKVNLILYHLKEPHDYEVLCHLAEEVGEGDGSQVILTFWKRYFTYRGYILRLPVQGPFSRLNNVIKDNFHGLEFFGNPTWQIPRDP